MSSVARRAGTSSPSTILRRTAPWPPSCPAATSGRGPAVRTPRGRWRGVTTLHGASPILGTCQAMGLLPSTSAASGTWWSLPQTNSGIAARNRWRMSQLRKQQAEAGLNYLRNILYTMPLVETFCYYQSNLDCCAYFASHGDICHFVGRK